LLLGRCRTPGRPIGLFYPLVELAALVVAESAGLIISIENDRHPLLEWHFGDLAVILGPLISTPRIFSNSCPTSRH
jgi:hypothetical protein